LTSASGSPARAAHYSVAAEFDGQKPIRLEGTLTKIEWTNPHMHLYVDVKDASGKPIDDADVSVQLFMPAMPTMNMPAMRNETKLSPAGGGVYRGSGQVMMAGRWDATVTVVRGGQRLGTKQLPVVAR